MNSSKGLPIRTGTPAKSWPYFGLGGLIVALTAITGMVAVHADRSGTGAANTPPPVVQSQASAASATVAQARPVLTYYLADSPDQTATADLLETEAKANAVEASLTVERRHHVYMIEAPQDELYVASSIAITSSELEQAGTWDFQVIDLRNHN